MTSNVSDKAQDKSISTTQKKRMLLSAGLLIVVLSSPLWARGFWIDFLQNRAESNLLARDPERSLKWLGYAQALDDQNARTRILLARAYRKSRDMEQAYAALKDYYELAGSTNAFQQEQWLLKAQIGNNSDLQMHLSEMLIEPEGNVQDICETYVNSCILNYQFNDALQILELWEADFPNDPLPNFMRGKMYEHKLGWQEAITEYQTTLKKDPGYAAAAYSLGRIQLTLKKTEEALEYYQRAIDSTENQSPAKVGIARCLRLMNRNDEAKQLLREVLALSVEQLQAEYQAMGDHKFEGRTAAQLAMGNLELADKNYEAALKWLEPAAKANPLDLGIKNSLALVYSRLGRKTEAKELSRVIKETNDALANIQQLLDQVQLKPADPELRFQIGKMYLNYVAEEQGVVWLNSVLLYQPDHLGAHIELARYYESNQSRGKNFQRLAELHRKQADASDTKPEQTP
ncbi:tetratricopeptide repeat protein [Gimesia algae]|uniref:Tetratricopeptide repeat protein n=1 Tax=Gimesia algae TaxID=2527971 RepID=A0A517V6Q0_9PLAN|nr:tetratricopeptide repeat protein [Gimesia algae]